MRRSHAEVLQSRCDQFNARWPIGTVVRYYPVKGRPEYREGRTVAPAQVLSGHTPILWVDYTERGCVALDSGCVALDNCKPQRADTPVQRETETTPETPTPRERGDQS